MSALVGLLIDNVRHRMDRQGWKIEPLADASGLDRSFLSEFLSGKRPNVSVRYTERIARALDCDVRDLLAPPLK